MHAVVGREVQRAIHVHQVFRRRTSCPKIEVTDERRRRIRSNPPQLFAMNRFTFKLIAGGEVERPSDVGQISRRDKFVCSERMSLDWG
jgi:hypothetical protein